MKKIFFTVILSVFAVCICAQRTGIRRRNSLEHPRYETVFSSGKNIHRQKNKHGANFAGGDTNKEWRKTFVNLSFANSSMSQHNGRDLKSNYGVAFTTGRTFYLHKPISDVLCFGVDATWLDVNYLSYDIKHITYWDTEKYQYNQTDISMHVGPSVVFEPIRKLAVQAYFRYAPTFATIYTGNDKKFYGGYASMWIAGGNVSYSMIGLGIEGRFGKANYKPMVSSGVEKFSSHLTGFRAYITFKF